MKPGGTRVIHELDAAGNVLRIGWEPAASVIEREKAVRQVKHLIETSAALLDLLHREAPDAIRQSEQHARWVQAITDCRLYVLVLKRDTECGEPLPMWETTPTSNRYAGSYRRAA